MKMMSTLLLCRKTIIVRNNLQFIKFKQIKYISMCIFVVDENVVNSDSNWFVNFYSPMCSHCHHLVPVWKEVSKLLDGVVKIAVVNCEDNWQLCHQLGIRSYPTLLHFKEV